MCEPDFPPPAPPKAMVRRVALAFALTLGLASVAPGSYAEELRFEEVIARATEESATLADAREALSDALAALSPGFDTDSIKLSLSGSGRYTPDPLPSLSPQAGVSLSVPIIPQISATADLSTDFEAVSSTYRLSISPLAAGKVTYKERKAYEQAALALITRTAALPYQVEAAIFDLAIAERSRTIAEEKLALAEAQSEVAKVKYELGDLGWSDYDTAVSDLSSAQRNLFGEEQSELDRRLKLVDLVGLELGSATITTPDYDALRGLIDARRARIDSESASATSAELLTAQIELRALEGQLGETRLFDPSLSISATADLPFRSAQVSASLTLSPGQFHREEREELEAAIAKQRDAVEIAARSFDFELRMLARTIESAERLFASSDSSVESVRIAHEVTSYYHAIGERTDLELEEARLSLYSAELSRYRNAVSLIGAYNDYLELIDIGQMAGAGK